MIRWFVVGGFWLTLAAGAFAQTTNQYTPVAPIPVGDILLSLPSSHIPAAKTWEVRFTHRFNQSIDAGNALHTLFGLDSGANTGIGLSYVPLRDVQIALLRTNTLETYEGSLKYVVMQQARVIPFTATLRGGVDWRNARDIEDRASYFAQAIVSRQIGSRLDLYVIPTYVTDAGRVVSGSTSAALFDHAFNVPVGVVLMILPAFSIVGEVIPPNHDLPDTLKADLGWAIGIKKAIGGHFFEILLTNSNGTSTDQYISSTFNGAPLTTGDLRLGFNIERRFGKGARR
ncbi:MAG TPA: DUF5777 family beta-barrel protein [Thermoanaerobaculia bacterium]|jgi:hypothetical protein|nr:DUF5777 family beta-barrel protein [Thermoanaerobaculia bacterium]